ncbi:MAG TPA: M66 family metalloprotease [Phenylobacterium sp.]|nr:M66 family metalloprotease [Phenylobacterium sp.]
MIHARTLFLAGSVLALVAGAAQATPTCTHLGYGAASSAKPNKLYLYFLAADDATYPEFGVDGLITSPAHRFDVTELGSYSGTAAALRGGVFDVVTDDYCEFNVEVISTTTAPPATFARRNTVAIGTDSQWSPTSWTWGLAQNVDTGDPTVVDFARVWAGTYQDTAGGAGGALNGANSTLERWARSIGGTAAHEAGHNYGLSHASGLVLAPGEDVQTHHVMASGSHFTDEQRAGYRRHFSDNEYSILASNVGLSVQTMWNWDFVNPNAQTATRLRMTFLSTQPSLSVAGPYTGNLSPWSAPTVSASLGTQTYKGVSYHRYQVTWATGQAWSGGAAGQVAGGASFHVGTGFTGVNYNTPDPIIITNVDLLDAGGTVLGLHPRLIGFDSGALDASDGTFAINAINMQAAVLRISDVRVQLFPRMLSIDAMLPGDRKPVDIFGEPMRPWAETRVPLRQASLKPRTDLRIPVAKLSDRRQVVEKVDERACADRGDRSAGPDTRGCRTGLNVSLFPSTTMLVTATVTDPAAKHWDAGRKAYVVGPVSTQIFYQIAGRHPDLNRNKVDDYIDIATGKAGDRNQDGVIDEVQRRTPARPPR